MKVLQGHLTTLDKKVVKQMLDNNMNEGSYKRVNYFISNENNVYVLRQEKMEWDCDFIRNKKIKRVYKSKFTL